MMSSLEYCHALVIVHVADVKYIASCSFGKDSTAMVLKLIEEQYPLDEVVFYDTGMEFNAVYQVRDMIVPILKLHNIKYTELKPDRPFWIDMMIREKKKRTGEIVYGDEWCGGACRWHTFKKKSICDKYTKDSIVYLGIACDETKRLNNLDVNKLAPLKD